MMNCTRNQRITLIVGGALLTLALLVAPYRGETVAMTAGKTVKVTEIGQYGFSLSPPERKIKAAGAAAEITVYVIDLVLFSIPIAIVLAWTGIVYAIQGSRVTLLAKVPQQKED